MTTQMTTKATMDKDPLFGTKGVKVGPSGSKALQDPTRLALSLNPETAKSLYETLGTLLNNERGVKLDIHYGIKTGETGSFHSAFFFVKPIGEMRSNGAQSFQRKEPVNTKNVAAEIKKIN